MAVETRFVVIRNNEEVKTFMDKKAADEYDRMLDIADGISEMLSESPIQLSDNDCETLSVFLAERREELLIALQAKKPSIVSKKKDAHPVEEAQDEQAEVVTLKTRAK